MEGALAGLVDHRLARRRVERGDDVVAGLAADQDAAHRPGGRRCASTARRARAWPAARRRDRAGGPRGCGSRACPPRRAAPSAAAAGPDRGAAAARRRCRALSPKPPGSRKSRCMSMMTRAVRPISTAMARVLPEARWRSCLAPSDKSRKLFAIFMPRNTASAQHSAGLRRTPQVDGEVDAMLCVSGRLRRRVSAAVKTSPGSREAHVSTFRASAARSRDAAPGGSVARSRATASREAVASGDATRRAGELKAPPAAVATRCRRRRRRAAGSTRKPFGRVPSARRTVPIASGAGTPAMKAPKAAFGSAQTSTAIAPAARVARSIPGRRGGPPGSA